MGLALWPVLVLRNRCKASANDFVSFYIDDFRLTYAIDVKRAPMILFVIIFDLAADECRPAVFVNQRCVFA